MWLRVVGGDGGVAGGGEWDPEHSARTRIELSAKQLHIDLLFYFLEQDLEHCWAKATNVLLFFAT